MSIVAISTCMFIVLSSSALLQTVGWRGIVPLHSTRKDVERLLGASHESRGLSSTYTTDEGKVLVFYSAGPCNKGVPQRWNVPLDTVISVTFQPRAKLLLSDLGLDRTKYRREREPHTDRVVYYFNKEDGIRISTRELEGEGEDVYSITYEPALPRTPRAIFV
jgi:hypothetical protein